MTWNGSAEKFNCYEVPDVSWITQHRAVYLLLSSPHTHLLLLHSDCGYQGQEL